MSPFHAKDGWYFERVSDDAVKVFHLAPNHGPADAEVVLDKDTWASVVASVSLYGDSAEGFARAMGLHAGQEVHKLSIPRPRQEDGS